MDNEMLPSEKIKPIIKGLTTALTSIAIAQNTMQRLAPMCVHLPLYKDMSNTIRSLQVWMQEIQRLPW